MRNIGTRLATALGVGLAFLALATPAMAGNFQQFLLQKGTPLVGDDYDYALAYWSWNAPRTPDLFAIKRQNTGSGRIEVHILSGTSNYQQFVLHTATPLTPLGDDFDFALTDWDDDNYVDLVAIKHRNTGSGKVEVHILSGKSGFQQFLLQTSTPLGPLGDDFDYAVEDSPLDGTPDLIAIKHRNTGTGTVEVHVLSGESNFQQFVLQKGTPLMPLGDDFAYGLDEWNFDRTPDIVAIKRTNTGTGTVEVHVLLGPSYQQFVVHTGTPLTSLGDDFQYVLADFNHDYSKDLYAIKRRNTGTGTIEVHVLAGPTPTPPAPPTGLHLIGHSSTQLTWEWSDNAADYHGITLERQNGSNWRFVWGRWAYGPQTMTAYESGLSPATTYCYRLTAYLHGTSINTYSPTVCATTDPAAPPPPPPAQPTSGTIIVTLTRDPDSTVDTGYRVAMVADPNPFLGSGMTATVTGVRNKYFEKISLSRIDSSGSRIGPILLDEATGWAGVGPTAHNFDGTLVAGKWSAETSWTGIPPSTIAFEIDWRRP